MGRRILPLLMAAAAVLGAGCEASVTGPNRPPVAVAGPDVVVDLRATATLDGSASWDPDEDPLTLSWELLARPPAGTADLDPVSDSAVDLTPDAIGVWVLGLTADDGALRSERDVVQVRVIQPCRTDLDCDDFNVCTSDRCETGSGCVHEPAAGPCDDGDDCTTGDTCDAGTCAGVPRDADGDGHGDPACGGDDCDDADARAYPGNFEGPEGDPVCGDGVDNDCDGDVDAADPGCLPCTQDSDCDDGKVCTQDSCDLGNSVCLHVPDHGLCDDGEYCNGVETCDLVLGCQPGSAVDCGDGIACTVDTCDEATDTCDHQPEDGPCDDGQFCNGVETCDPALDCQPGTDPCPGQTCDDGLDQCVDCTGDPNCDDGIFCNGAETCSGGFCQTGVDPGPGEYCDGTDLVTCDGAGNESSRTVCAQGCNVSTVPNRCYIQVTETFGENNSNDHQGVVEDVSVERAYPNTNFDSGEDIDGHNIGYDWYLWIRFDLSAVPGTATIQAASLHLYTQYRTSGGVDQIFELAAAAETTPGLSWVDSSATWNRYDGTNSWTGGNDGGYEDRGQSFSSVTIPQSPNNVWYEWVLNVDGVSYLQSRIPQTATFTMYGIVDTYRRQFPSSEDTQGRRPYLEVTYIY